MTDVQVRSEAAVYRPDVRGFLDFRDLALRSRNSDSAARLERHGRQMEAEFERRARQATVTGPDGVEVRGGTRTAPRGSGRLLRSAGLDYPGLRVRSSPGAGAGRLGGPFPVAAERVVGAFAPAGNGRRRGQRE